MRSRFSLLALFFAIGSFALPQFAHAAIPFFGPIIPDAYNVCPASWGLLVMVINNIIEFSITIAIVFVAPIMIAYSGFLYVVNPANPGGIAKAKSILSNTIIGIIVAIAGWAIVDAVMAVFYHPNDSAWGTWSSLITSGNIGPCIDLAQSLNQSAGQSVTGVSGGGTVVNVKGKAAAQCSSSNTACSPAFLESVGFTPAQAKTMSCIAVTENGGNAVGCNGNACGTFQIMLTVNQLVGPACGGMLNCPALCKGNNGAAVKTAACQPCVRAANNATCNAQSTQYLASHPPSKYAGNPYWAWTPPASDNKKASACVQQYSNG